MTHSGTWAPKAGERYRFSFKFNSAEEATAAFDELTKGRKVLSDFKNFMDGKSEYKDCI
jgi:hypothetical protein